MYEHQACDERVLALCHVIARLRAELAEYKTRVTLGGPPPKCDLTWANKKLPGGADPEYQGLT